MVEITSYSYEKSFVINLPEFLTWNQHLSDFTIVCSPDNVQIQCYKIILAMRSKFFEALFRQENEIKELKVDFGSDLMKVILESLVTIDDNLRNLDVEVLLQLLQIIDYFQMDELSKEIQILLSEKLSLEKILDIVEISEFLHVPHLQANYCQFIKHNLLHLDLTKMPKPLLRKLVSSPPCLIKDSYGRLFDQNESELKLFEALLTIDPNEDWNFSEDSRKRLWFTINDQDLMGQKSYEVSKPLKEVILNQVQASPQSLLYDSKNSSKQLNKFCSSKRKIFTTLPFGKGDPLGSWGYPEWSVEGNIRRIDLKSRFWGNEEVIQGIRIFLEDKSVHSITNLIYIK